MCKPHRCPHINMTGNICVYCPGGPDSDFEYSTQSYTGYEPTSMRASKSICLSKMYTLSFFSNNFILQSGRDTIPFYRLATASNS